MTVEAEVHSIEQSGPCCQYEFYAKIAGVLLFLTILKIWINGGVVKKRRDLTNQIVVITGGNAGIGFETAKDLVRNGATLILATRNEQRGQKAVDELNKIRPNSSEYMKLDLSDLTSVRVFANQFKSKYNRLNILINNAGIMAIATRELTKDGFESQIGTNHFGHFLLTHLLLDTLKATPQFRIITVASRAHIRFTLNLDDYNFDKTPYKRFAAYSASKIANVLFTMQLNKVLEAQKANGKTVCLHPGLVKTEIANHFTGFNILYPIVYPLVMLLFKSPRAGAQTTLHCVYEDFDKLEQGKYYVDCKTQATQNKSVVTFENAEKLWNISMKALKL